MKILCALYRLARRVFGQRHYPEIILAGNSRTQNRLMVNLRKAKANFMAHDVVINITYRAPRKEGENGKTLVNASGNPSPWMVCKMLLDALRMAATKVSPWIEEQIQEVRDQYESPIIDPRTGQTVKHS